MEVRLQVVNRLSWRFLQHRLGASSPDHPLPSAIRPKSAPNCPINATKKMNFLAQKSPSFLAATRPLGPQIAIL
jgi:hypothetical protein